MYAERVVVDGVGDNHRRGTIRMLKQTHVVVAAPSLGPARRRASRRGLAASLSIRKARASIDVLVTRLWLRRSLVVFLAITAAMVLVVALILARVMHASIEREALQGTEQTATTFADIVFEPEEFRNGRPTREGLADLDRLMNSSTTIEELRLVTRSGEVLYSSSGLEMSERAVDLDDFLPALGGQPTSESTSYAAELGSDQGSARAFVKATVPVGADRRGEPLAALAVYVPYATVADDVGDATRTMEFVLGGAALLLYLLLIPTVRHASNSFSGSHDPTKAITRRRLARAIKEDQIVLHYQPKLDLATERVTGVEALVRWEDPDRGLVPPDSFIPAAEEGPVMEALTLRVLELACRQRAQWMLEGINLRVAVNISASSLCDRGLPAKFEAVLNEQGVSAAGLTLEITEGVVMEDFESSLGVMEQLSAMGFRISVDDFGKGHSSLVRLDKLPLQELKIDRGFIETMAAGGQSEIVEAIIAVAHGLGLTAVAEGVEDQLILDRLGAGGCDEAQGFHICRPVTADTLKVWLSDRSKLNAKLKRHEGALSGSRRKFGDLERSRRWSK